MGTARDVGSCAEILEGRAFAHPTGRRCLIHAMSVTQLVFGPMLALGLLTRLVAVPIVIFLLVSNYERWRVGGYFWNKTGLEYTLMWSLGVLYFLVHGGGAMSLDHLLIGREW